MDKGIIGVIDIGTNSILLLIASFDRDELHTLHEEFKTVRLGERLTEDRRIHLDAIERAVGVLKEYQETCKKYSCKKIIAVGTEVFREAKNTPEVLDILRKNCDIEVKVLSSREEGRSSILGAMAVLDLSRDKDYMCVDIGGGSSEIAYVKKGKISNTLSIPMGALKAAERFSLQPPVDDLKIKKTIDFLKRYFEDISFQKGLEMVGIGGTATTMAFMYKRLAEYDVDEINGTRLTIANIEEMLKGLESMKLGKIVELTKDVGRARIIIAGIILILEIMQASDTNEILISSGGLRNGIAYEYFYKMPTHS